MKIVITAKGPELDSAVDPRFGRAAYFLVYDLESDTCETVSNESGRSAGQGAGVQAAQLIADRGVGAVLTGNCGPKAHQLLDSAKVAIYTGVEGTAAEAVERFRGGTMSPTDGPNVEGHWS